MPAINRIDTATRAAPEAATARDAKALVRRALVREPKLRAKMVRLAETDYVRGRDFQRVYLRSFPAKVAAVVAAAKKLRMGFTDAQVIELAKGLDPFKGTGEAVQMRAQPKPGGFRPITTFGIQNKSLQVLAERAARPFIQIHPHQFDARGNGGNPAAARRILDLIGAGYVHVLVADVAGNFNSLSAEGVKEMIPLPPTVTEAVVLARGLNFNPNQRRYQDAEKTGSRRRDVHASKKPEAHPGTCRSHDTIQRYPTGIVRYSQSGLKLPSRLKEAMRRGRRGISQGSTGSPLFSAAVHEPMVRRISREVEVVHYTDNFYLFSKTRAGALRAAKTLQAEFQRSPAGPLLSSDFIIKDARQGFKALGYRFRVKNGRAAIRMDYLKMNLVWIKFHAFFDAIVAGQGRPGEPTYRDAVRYLDGWCAAHSEWPKRRRFRKLLIARMVKHQEAG